MNARAYARRYAALTGLRWFAVGLVVPVLVLLVQARASLAQVGQLMALYGATVVVLELPTGGLAGLDRTSAGARCLLAAVGRRLAGPGPCRFLVGAGRSRRAPGYRAGAGLGSAGGLVRRLRPGPGPRCGHQHRDLPCPGRGGRRPGRGSAGRWSPASTGPCVVVGSGFGPGLPHRTVRALPGLGDHPAGACGGRVGRRRRAGPDRRP